MTNHETQCTDPSPGLRDALLAYLYDECEPEERQQVEQHVTECRRCAEELESLRSVRGTLAAWTPPDPAFGFRVIGQPESPRSWWRPLLEPSWGLAVAAALVLVVGAAIASVEIRYDAEGLTFRMGWSPPGREAAAAAALPVGGGDVASPEPGRDGRQPPWRTDLVNLENALRRDLAVRAVDSGVVAVPDTADDPVLLDEMRGLIAQSERRQQQELALWFTEFAQEFDMQRRADQQRVQQELGDLEGYADYLVRTSGR